MIKAECQDVLLDKSSTGRIRPWREKKIANQLLSVAYEDIDKNKAERLKKCATWLEFINNKLTNANFCRVRLCPMCSWRRGLKIFSHTSAIMNGLESEKSYGYVFLTLTVKNCDGDSLSSALDDMFSSWQRLSQLKAFKDVVKGWFRCLEVTHDMNQYITHDMYYDIRHSSRKAYYDTIGVGIGDKNPNFDKYHPHFHVILAVNKSYFTNNYLKHSEWREMWRKASRLDYDPMVNVKRIKGNTCKAVAETAKYAVKDSDYIIPDDWNLTVNTVKILDSALDCRRLVAYGGKMKEWHKKLNLDDDLDGDLINITTEQETVNQNDDNKTYYSWNVGYNQYSKC